MSRKKYSADLRDWDDQGALGLSAKIPPSSARDWTWVGARILEIGPSRYFKRLLPEQTSYYRTGRPSSERKNVSPSGWPTIFRLIMALRRGDYDVVAVGPLRTPLWRRDRCFFSNLGQVLKSFFRGFESLGQFVVCYAPKNTPLLVIDRMDEPMIGRHNFWLLKRCRRYFKRELPQNHWNVFLNTTSRNETVANLRTQQNMVEALAKLRPIPLLPGLESLPARLTEPSAKSIDIFYAGVDGTTTVRLRGRALLEVLLVTGKYRMDLPSKPLPQAEFLERCSRSWLVWSPEGQGWDCWRHYEALAMGAVPIINYPSIDRYQPLLDREHCFLYGCEGSSLLDTLADALSDKDRLLRMAEAGWRHIEKHYTREALLLYLAQ